MMHDLRMKPKYRVKNSDGCYVFSTPLGFIASNRRTERDVYHTKLKARRVRDWMRGTTNNQTWKVVRIYPAKSPVQPIPGDV